jgi:membrane-associated protease RseP (regulator of RpoE activity)
VKDPLEEPGVEVNRRGAATAGLIVLAGLVALVVLRPSTLTALAIIAGIVTMVMLHECGHYLVAKRSGMKVTEFFLGFGPRLWSFRRGETEYGVKAIPAGGYVRIIGMTNLEEVDPDDDPRTFRRGSYRDRFLLTIAGVSVNVLIAFVLFFIVVAGEGRVVVGPNTTVSTVVTHSAASNAGFRDGDRIVSVDGQPISNWNGLKNAIESRAEEATTFTVVRDQQLVTLHATPARQSGKGFLGVGPGTQYRSVGVLGAVPQSFRSMWDITSATGSAFAHLVSPAGLSSYAKDFTSKSSSSTATAGSSSSGSSSSSSQDRPVSIIGIVTQGSTLVGGNVWALLWLLGAISLILPALRRWPRGRRRLRVGRVEGPGPRGPGRLPQADAADRGGPGPDRHPEPLRRVPRRPAGLRRLSASPAGHRACTRSPPARREHPARVAVGCS